MSEKRTAIYANNRATVYQVETPDQPDTFEILRKTAQPTDPETGITVSFEDLLTVSCPECADHLASAWNAWVRAWELFYVADSGKPHGGTHIDPVRCDACGVQHGSEITHEPRPGNPFGLPEDGQLWTLND